MSCDADLVAVLVDPDGSPLDVADTVYQFPTKQRTAVINRDQHCTYGTCTTPAAWCAVHHLRAFQAGGPTAVSNAALLCGVHHRYVHAHHLVGVMTAAGVIAWRAPAGRDHPPAPPPAVDRAITALANRWRRRQQQRDLSSVQPLASGREPP